jgi:hypothetical protein
VSSWLNWISGSSGYGLRAGCPSSSTRGRASRCSSACPMPRTTGHGYGVTAGTSQCGMPPGNGGRRRGRGSIGSLTRRWSATARSTSSSSIRNCRSVRRPAGTPRATTVSAPAWAPTTAAGTLVAAGTRSLRPSPFNGGRHSTHVGTWYGRRQDVGRVLVLGLDTRPPPPRTRGPASRGTITTQASHDRQRMGLR